MKRVITLIMAIFMLATSCFALSGCGRTDVKTIGDFRFRYKEGSVVAHLHDLSDTGKEKTTLVIPSHLPNGLPVTSMGGSGFFAGGVLGNIVSEKLEKIFIPSIITSIPDHSIQSASPIIVVIAPSEAADPLVLGAILYSGIKSVKTVIVNVSTFNDLISEAIKQFNPSSAVSRIVQRLKTVETRLKQPNVEFYLNYETENPLFWFDYETGDYIHKYYQGTYAPTREGYTFAGWYTEPECINDWNFDIDKMPKYETEESITANLSESDVPTDVDGIATFYKKIIESIATKANAQERVKLYAKWTKE